MLALLLACQQVLPCSLHIPGGHCLPHCDRTVRTVRMQSLRPTLKPQALSEIRDRRKHHGPSQTALHSQVASRVFAFMEIHRRGGVCLSRFPDYVWAEEWDTTLLQRRWHFCERNCWCSHFGARTAGVWSTFWLGNEQFLIFVFKYKSRQCL